MEIILATVNAKGCKRVRCFNVKGQLFTDRREAKSYARNASTMFAGSSFPVQDEIGKTVNEFLNGKDVTKGENPDGEYLSGIDGKD